MTTGASRARQQTIEEPAPVSLLWPSGEPPTSSGSPHLPPDSAADLQVAALIDVLVGSDGLPARRYQRERLVRQTLSELCTDGAILAYRQAVVEELLQAPALRERLASLLPELDALPEAGPAQRFQTSEDGTVQRIVRQLGDLELFVEVARSLERALGTAGLRAAALRNLAAYVQTIVSAPTFLALEAELPALRETLSRVRSVTIGVNLTPDLAPEAATILTLSEEPLEGARTLLGRLLGGIDASRGITPLQRTGGFGGAPGQPNRLTRDLTKLLEDVVAPVARALARFSAAPTGVLARIGPELALLLNGALLVERLERAGLPMCRPTILPPDDRVTAIHEGYDVSLALRLFRSDGSPAGIASAPSTAATGGPNGSADGVAGVVGIAGVITNEMAFDDALGRVWVLTGPNRAGKTTYTRAVGLAHILFQAGLFVPGSAARLSPVDAIYTHFPSNEQAHPGMGRLDEEADRLAGIFKRATPRSMVLLNETLAGTAASEAIGIARGALRGLRLLGARAVYVTHLHELALAVDELNFNTPGASLVGSLVADAEDEDDTTLGPRHRRTFRIHPGVPAGRSYASEIADRYGISYPQLAALLRERGFASMAETEAKVESAGDRGSPHPPAPSP